MTNLYQKFGQYEAWNKILTFLRMGRYAKHDSKTFFFNNVFGYDEYFSSYSQKKNVYEFRVKKIELYYWI